MKKTYMMPEMFVAHIELQQMVAASPGEGAKTLYNDEAAANSGVEGTVLSRRSSLWDDEDEE